MPTPTYDLIEEKVLPSAAPLVVFNSIPGTYKDLVLEVVARESANVNAANVRIRFNSDTGSNYSRTFIEGNGSTAPSGRDSNLTYLFPAVIVGNNAGSSTYSTSFVNVMSYANTNVNKTCVSRSSIASTSVSANVSLWRSTSAITQMDLTTDQTGFASGSVFRLWGVAG